MNLRIFSTILLLSFCHAQWIDLDLTPELGTGFKGQVAPLIQGLALATTVSSTRSVTHNHRIAVSGTMINLHSNAFRGSFPLVSGLVAAAKNLTLSGSLAAFRSDNDIVLHTGYGLGIVPGESPWEISLHVGTLQGSRNLRLHSLQLAATYGTSLGSVPLDFQFGFIDTRATFSFPGVADAPKTLNRRFYALQLATAKEWGTILFVPKLIWHPEVVLLSLETRLNIY
ncbi:MAG: hypothetical protein ACE5D8_05615 [Fidelibacterota bacterium]